MTYGRPRAERKSTEVWQAPLDADVKAAAAGKRPSRIPIKKEAKLSLVEEEDFLEEVFDEGVENRDAAVKKGPRIRSRKSTLGSVSSLQAAANDEDSENNGALKVKERKPLQHQRRRSTLGSIGSLQDQVFVDKKPADEQQRPKAAAAARAPKKSKKVLTLPMTPNDNLLSPSITASAGVSPFPLPPGVVCIDLDDGSEQTYFKDIVEYKKTEEAVYASNWNYTNWKLAHMSQKRSEKTREVLLDWIMEVVHYFKAGQETLFNAVHLIDRYVTSKHDSIPHGDIQLVGATAVLLATKLEEYYPADINMLVKLCQDCFSGLDIRRMELDIMKTLDFNTYCLDPMIFLNRFMRAAFRQEDRMFVEACNFFLDATVTVVPYWALKTSKKCAAAVYAALCLVGGPSGMGGGGAEPLWTPTLVHYTGYSDDQICLLARQMLGLLEKTLAIAPDQDCGIRVKYNSLSRHSGFLKSVHCSPAAIEKAESFMTQDNCNKSTKFNF